MSVIVRAKALRRLLDVSKPWLNRVVEREPKAFLTAVADVDFEIEEGSVYALVGESGSGKSTIGKMVVGLTSATDGTIEIDGTAITGNDQKAKISEARQKLQMIFQDPYASLNPRWKVRDIIAEPAKLRGFETKVCPKGCCNKSVYHQRMQISIHMSFRVDSGNAFALHVLFRLSLR